MHEDTTNARSSFLSAASPISHARRVAATAAVTGALVVLAAGCGASGKESIPGISGSGATLTLNEVGNGFGQLLPHRVRELDEFGQLTGQVLSIRSFADIVNNVRRGNEVLPSTAFLETAVAPDGSPGNHYLFANFTQILDPFSVLNASPSNSGLSGSVSVTTINPVSGVTLAASGRAFVGGKTLLGPAIGSPPRLQLIQVVEQNINPFDVRYGALRPILDENDEPVYPQALGFPGVTSIVPNAGVLVSDNTVVFVADTNANLLEFETFPVGVQIRFRVTTALQAQNGEHLIAQVLATSTVGLDVLAPEVITTPPPSDSPLITPGSGDVDVDPLTNIRIEFSESVQPYSVGTILGTGPPTLSSAIQIVFGPSTSVTTMPFNAIPISPFDFSIYEMVPGFAFPGRGPEFQSCGTFSRVDINLLTQVIEDLAQVESSDPNTPGVFGPNTNRLGATTFFETGEGPGLVNAPVAPDTIYVGRGGAQPGISIVDLNGFGQSTGNPTSSQPFPLRGESHFQYDPNVTQNPTIRPLLIPGECTLDGGSAGVFTLVRDTSLQDIVVRSPLVSAVTDIHIGHALDRTFRNAPPPFGCQSGGGNVCALDGLKVIASVLGNQPNTVAPAQVNQFGAVNPGFENTISWAPHPNPPTLAFPPQCVTPFLAGNEPTTIDTIVNNFLVSGNPFPIPSTNTPPSGLLTLEQNVFFLGPSFGQTQSANCSPYQQRQQIGHFLYVADRPRSEIVVFNSNRMTVIDRISVSDPTSLAIGPNLDVLAIANQLADTVTFIDVNPQSAQFHQVIRTVQVGNSPRGIAFEPTNEDILVCNEMDSTVSIIAAGTLEVRRTVGSQLNRPFEVCVTPRMVNFSFNRQVYFAHVLNRTGAVALFESGPNGTNGWGFDDIIGIIPFLFQAPKTVQIDPINLDASVYIVHEGPINVANGTPGNLGVGAISRLRIESALSGALPLQSIGVGNPNFRDAQFSVPLSINQANGQLSGIPLDIAFDNQRNVGAIPGPSTSFSAGSPLPANHKANIRPVPGGFINSSEPQFMFASVPNPIGGSGVIDVLALGLTGTPLFDTDPYLPGIQSILVPNVTLLSDYWRQ